MYRKLHLLRSRFPKVAIMALTATATSRVQTDIVSQLRLKDPVRLVSSFNRPNVHYTGMVDFAREGSVVMM